MSPEDCEHGGEGWPSMVALKAPLRGQFRCSDCGALAYRKKGPGFGGRRRGRLRLYVCRHKDCDGVVVERKFGRGWQYLNGCSIHPVRS